MRTVEAELHQMLLDILPGHCDSNAQARIVAEAAAIYKRDLRFKIGRRMASQDSKLVEAQMMDALLQAMGHLNQWDDEEEPDILDCRGMSPEQVVRAAGRLGDQYDDVINPDDFDVFFYDEDQKGEEPWDFNFEDGFGRTSRYQTPGTGKHRSDSQSGA